MESEGNGQAQPKTWAGYRRRHAVLIVLLVVFAPFVGLASCTIMLSAGIDALGPCGFDPPPGSFFAVHVVNDTKTQVQVHVDQSDAAPVRLRPGASANSLIGSCGDELHVVSPGKPEGCLDVSSQDVETPAPLRVSDAVRCDRSLSGR